MRQETITITYYNFNELSEKAKNKVVNELWDINVYEYWHDFIYEDAKSIGINIDAFDIYIYNRNYCEISLLDHETNVIKNILKEYKDCELYKLAKEYEHKMVDSDGNIDKHISDQFIRELSEVYLQDLRRNYEYLTSLEAIVETIEANEYEFDINGNIL